MPRRRSRLSALWLEDRITPVADVLDHFDGISLLTDRANNTVGGVPQYTDVNQPNPSGAAGPAHLVSVVNRSIEWVKKDNTGKTSQSLWTFFNNGLTAAGQPGLPTLGTTPTPFDPRTVYDPYANRFVVTAAQKGAVPTNAATAARVLVAISKTADPTQGWLFTAVTPAVPDGGSGTYAWVDYPQVSVDNQAVYITGDLFKANSDTARPVSPQDGKPNGTRLWVLPKGTLDTDPISPTYGGYTAGLYFNGALPLTNLDGTPRVGTTSGFDPFRYSGVPAKVLVSSGATTAIETTLAPALTYGYAQLGGAAPAVYLVAFGPSTSSAATAAEQMQVIKVAQPLDAAPTFTYSLVGVGDVDASAGTDPNADTLPDARQLGDGGASGRFIDTGPHRVSQAVWRADYLSFAATVQAPAGTPDAGQATAQWFRLYAPSYQNNPPPSTPTTPQTGTLGSAAGVQDWTYYPALAEDSFGNLAVGYSGSGPNLAPGAYYAGVAVNGAEYTPLPSREVKAGTNRAAFVRLESGTNRNRWGDQSSLALDPDGVTFWAFNQYATGTNTWGTHWGRFSVNGQGVVPPTAVPDGLPAAAAVTTSRSASRGVLANDYVLGGGALVVANPGTFYDGPNGTGNKLVLRPDGSYDFTPGPSGSATTAVFSYQATNGKYSSPGTLTVKVAVAAQVSGLAWQETNPVPNGVREVGEPVMAGVGVTLFNTATALDVAQTVTDATGRYTFGAVTPGSYRVRFATPPAVPAPSYTFAPYTAADPTANGANLTDADSNGKTATFTVASGAQLDNVNAGLIGVAPWFGWGQQVYESYGAQSTSDALGNVYTVGVLFGGGEIDLDPGPGKTLVTMTGDLAGYIAAYSPTGAIRWAKVFANNATDISFASLKYDPTTNSLLTTGMFVGTNLAFDPAGGSLLSSDEKGDVFAAKFDLSGNLAWARDVVNAPFSDSVTGGVVDAAGNFILAGVDSGPFTPAGYSTVAFGGGNQDAWVAKLTPAGGYAWVYGYGGAGSDSAQNVEVDAAGNIYLVNQTGYDATVASAPFDAAPRPDQTVTIPAGPSGYSHVVVTKIDPTGSHLWSRQFASSVANSTYPSGLVVQSDGTVVAALAYSGTVNHSGTVSVSRGGTDTNLVFLNGSTGAVQTTRHYGSGGNEQPTMIARDPSDNLYVVGGYTGKMGFNETGAVDLNNATGYPDVYVVKLSSTGNYVTSRAFASPYDDYVFGIGFTPDGRALVNMYASGSMDLDPGPGTFYPGSAGGVVFRASADLFNPIQSSTIAGRVWDDANGNGVQDDGEGGVANAVVELLSGPSLLASTVSSATGTYSFVGSYQGRFTVRVRPPAARPNPGFPTYTFSPRAAGTDSAKDSDAEPSGTAVGQATVVADFNTTATADAGLVGRKAGFGWAARVGDNSGNGYTGAVAVAPDGSVYTSGRFYQSADFDNGPGVTQLTYTSMTLYVAKYTPDGALAWVQPLAVGAGNVLPTKGGLAVDSAGNVIVTGEFSGTGNFLGVSLTSPGTPFLTGFIVKLTPAGGLLWAKHLAPISTTGSGYAHMYGLTVDYADNIVFSLAPDAKVDLDPGPGTAAVLEGWPGETDVVKWDANGNLVTANWFIGLAASSSLAVIRNPASTYRDDLYLAGGFSGSVSASDRFGWTGSFNSLGYTDGFLFKLNLADLRPSWVRVQGTSGDDYNLAVGASPLGGAAVTGRQNFYYSSAIRYDSFGIQQFSKLLVGVQSNQGQSVGFSPAGDMNVTGTFSGATDFDPGPGVYTLTPTGNGGFYVWNLDGAYGNLNWAVANGGTQSNSLVWSATDGQGYVYGVGNIAGTADFDPGPSQFNISTASTTKYDGYVFKLYTGQPQQQTALRLVSGSTRPGTALNSTTTVRVQGQTAANTKVELMQRLPNGGTAPLYTGQVDAQGNPIPISTVSLEDGTYSLDSPTLLSFLPTGATSAVVKLVARAYNAVGKQFLDSTDYEFGVNNTDPVLMGVDVSAAGNPATGPWTDTAATGGQRSRVSGLQVRFGQAVVKVPATWDDVLLITRVGDGLVLTTDDYEATPTADGKSLVVTFTGTRPGLLDGNSLADGRYTVALRTDNIQSGPPATLTPGKPVFSRLLSDAPSQPGPLSLHRLFGDGNGDTTVDFDDLNLFGGAFGTTAGNLEYRAEFDANLDGAVDFDDLNAFGGRFGTSI